MNDDQRGGGEPTVDALGLRLERLGSTQIEMTPERLDGLWSDVAALIEEPGDDVRHGAVVLVDDRASDVPRRRFRAPQFAVAAASVLIVMMLSLFMLGRGDDALVVAAAQDALVTYPGAAAVVATDGTELRDGATLDVAGFVEVGDRRYGPGRYRVSDGRLLPIVDDPPQVFTTDEGSVDVTLVDDPVGSIATTTRPNTQASVEPTAGEPADPSSTLPSEVTPVERTPETTTPSRTTVLDRDAADSTVPEPTRTTTAPTPTRAPPGPTSTAVTTTVTDTRTVASTTAERPTTTTTTTEVRRRPAPAGSESDGEEAQTR